MPADNDDDRFVQRFSGLYREKEDAPTLRYLIETLTRDLNRHIEQEEKRRAADRELLEKIDARVDAAEQVLAQDATRAKFAREIGNAVIKLVTLVAVLVGAGVAFLKFKSGMP